MIALRSSVSGTLYKSRDIEPAELRLSVWRSYRARTLICGGGSVPRIRGAGRKVSRVVISVGAAVRVSQHRSRIAGRGRRARSFETVRRWAVSNKIQDAGAGWARDRESRGGIDERNFTRRS
jgi:hypothetical protein